MNNQSEINKISFSELKIWNECPYKHKLYYFDNLKVFKGNEYTAFGTAMHYVCETLLPNNNVDAKQIFENKFNEELNNLEKFDEELISKMIAQAPKICEYILPELKSRFGNFEIISIEEELLEPVNDFSTKKPLNFKGFIDLVIRTEDMRYHIIDWKTCSWGWDAKKRSDPMTVYQLTYYKNYFSNKHNIDSEIIDTHFILLKRTATKNLVEIVEVSSGPRRTKNSINLLEKAIKNMENNNFLKNRLSCKNCEFYKTEHCK
tara:strand:- start:9 stop:791 length:783 start_codon:yes stop_codon:yes gene_type:complete